MLNIFHFLILVKEMPETEISSVWVGLLFLFKEDKMMEIVHIGAGVKMKGF